MLYRANSIKIKRISINNFILLLYFLIAPFEDILNFGQGTILKYLALIYIVLTMFDLLYKRYKIRINDPIILIPLYFIVLSYFSVIWSLDPQIAISKNTTYMLLEGFFVITYIRGVSKQEKRLLDTVIIVSGLLLSAYIFSYGTFYDQYRIVLAEGNDPNNLAALLILPLFVSFSKLVENNNNKKTKVLNFGILGITLFTLLMTGSRGALLCIALAFCIFCLKYLSGSARFKSIFIIIGLVVICWAVLSYLPPELLDRFFGMNEYARENINAYSRTNIWKIIIENIIPVMPLYGYGSGCAPFVVGKYLGINMSTHNMYLNMILEYGVLGLPIFIYFLYVVFKRFWDQQSFGKLCAFISILGIAFFLEGYSKKYFWDVMIYCLVDVKGINYYKSGMQSFKSKYFKK